MREGVKPRYLDALVFYLVNGFDVVRKSIHVGLSKEQKQMKKERTTGIGRLCSTWSNAIEGTISVTRGKCQPQVHP